MCFLCAVRTLGAFHLESSYREGKHLFCVECWLRFSSNSPGVFGHEGVESQCTWDSVRFWKGGCLVLCSLLAAWNLVGWGHSSRWDLIVDAVTCSWSCPKSVCILRPQIMWACSSVTDQWVSSHLRENLLVLPTFVIKADWKAGSFLTCSVPSWDIYRPGVFSPFVKRSW